MYCIYNYKLIYSNCCNYPIEAITSYKWDCVDEPFKDEAQTALFKDPVRTAL